VPDIFDEIQEDLRTERAQRLLKRYGWAILAALVAVIAGVGGWQYYQHRLEQQDAAAASAYVTALNAVQGSLEGPAQKAEIPAFAGLTGASTPAAYRTLARFQEAGLKAANGDLPGAQTIWEQIAADSEVDSVLRDFAVLTITQHSLDHGDPTQLQARLKPLGQAANPWSALAREQLAVLDLRLGKTDDARTALQALSTDFLAPSGLRARASALLASVGGPAAAH
jgi:hypothetical protein